MESVLINGTKLFYSINKGSIKKPLILYLHGGPGDACIPLTKKFNATLEKDFTFVNLEQRGCGLSYYPFSKSEELSVQTILEDIYQFVLYLLVQGKQNKIILMGHSWGSVLGILFIKEHPEVVSKYIGVGQVVNMSKNIELQKEYLNKTGQGDRIDSLDFINDPVSSSLTLTKKIVSTGGSLYGKKNYTKLILPFVFSKDYSIKDLVHRIKGSNQSIIAFWEELLEINLESITEFAMPVLFCEGRHDYHVPSILAAEYFSSINSSKRLVWFENSAHFPQWEEPEKFNFEITAFVNTL
ncbi:alpha/beta fold hydrolase [Enterococcus sp. AZ109]|uniref:alpha/beta fold hydrolase n=1 Tax=Enterococcus sp. AZ109 TaxID=2774634 RepID=UPI003F68521D